MELVLIFIISALMIPLAIFTEGPVRIVLGLLFALFFPGYSLMAALFPRKTGLETVTRLALSLGTGIALAVLLLLLLNATPWGVRLYAILTTMALFTGVTAAVAWRRRRGFSPGERFDPLAKFNLKGILHPWAEKSRFDRILNALLALAVIGVIGTVGFVIAQPAAGESFTEFYLLDTEGTLDYYPTKLAVGEEGKVITGIINHESEAEVYNIEVVLDGETVQQIGPLSLEEEERWEQEVGFTPVRAGPGQKVEFGLYTADGQLYRRLHLWVDVSGE
jgi:uncharacterized membrane protein